MCISNILFLWKFADKYEFLIHSLEKYFLSEPESPCKWTQIIDHSCLFLCLNWLYQFKLLSVGGWKTWGIDDARERRSTNHVDMMANVEMPTHIHVQTPERRTPRHSPSSLSRTKINLHSAYWSGLAHNDFLVIPTLGVLSIQEAHNYLRFNDFSPHMQVCGLSDQIACSYF